MGLTHAVLLTSPPQPLKGLRRGLPHRVDFRLAIVSFARQEFQLVGIVPRQGEKLVPGIRNSERSHGPGDRGKSRPIPLRLRDFARSFGIAILRIPLRVRRMESTDHLITARNVRCVPLWPLILCPAPDRRAKRVYRFLSRF